MSAEKQRSFGKYDALDDGERKRLSKRAMFEAAAWSAMFVLMLHWKDRWFADDSRFSWPSLLYDLVALAVSIRPIVLMFRAISILSPNPRRRPKDPTSPPEASE